MLIIPRGYEEYCEWLSAIFAGSVWDYSSATNYSGFSSYVCQHLHRCSQVCSERSLWRGGGLLLGGLNEPRGVSWCVSRLLLSSGRWRHDVSVWTGFSLCPYYCYHGVSTPSLVVLNGKSWEPSTQSQSKCLQLGIAQLKYIFGLPKSHPPLVPFYRLFLPRDESHHSGVDGKVNMILFPGWWRKSPDCIGCRGWGSDGWGRVLPSPLRKDHSSLGIDYLSVCPPNCLPIYPSDYLSARNTSYSRYQHRGDE